MNSDNTLKKKSSLRLFGEENICTEEHASSDSADTTFFLIHGPGGRFGLKWLG